MVDTFYIVISAASGFLGGAVVFGGIISQQLGNRLVEANKEKAKLNEENAKLARKLLNNDSSADYWFAQYSLAANERDALLDKYTPLRNSDGTFAKRAA